MLLLLLTTILFQRINSQVLMSGSCPAIPVHKQFSPDKFLGSWYEIERYYSDFQVNTKCNKIDFSYGADGRIGLVTSAIREGSGAPLVSYGLTNFEYGDSARMTLSINPSPSSPSNEEINYWVLDTDYESYAVVWGCQEICGGRQRGENLWILGRTALLPRDVINRIYNKIKVLRLDPKRFLKVNQHQCVNVAVSVRSENSVGSGFDRNSARKFLSDLTGVFKRNHNKNRFF